MTSVQDDTKELGGKSAGASAKLSYKGREIAALIQQGAEAQFDVMPSYDDLDDDFKDCIRIHQPVGLQVPGNRAAKENVDDKCILYANDKAGLSAVLNLHIPPGATFEANLRTWLNPCHGSYGIEPNFVFGLGVVPAAGTVPQQNWPRSEFSSCIDNGVQFYAELKMPSFDQLQGSTSFAALMAQMSAGSMMEKTVTVYENGNTKQHAKGTLSLAKIHVRVTRDASGDSEMLIQSGHHKHAIHYQKQKGDADDLQLYVNALSWADNMTYVQFEDVELTHGDSGTEEEELKQPARKKGKVKE
eukprot:CAMPEP_0197434776 /NCGR_PEP_ID=MMETSP1175-20131217/2462_1 /TAXON_ID=1003142 /ORGANISM="Triceratium dubium, Strain CCMP147" /LENGTH=300 /DNA_ID=CAMNT_0042963617 /DNA_START=143 /DNA_END=1045 /DNA_ORIENTATION=-